ncbi:MAG: hypothetical protein ABIP54_03455 [Candidatus Andersenbacteria bacterium]
MASRARNIDAVLAVACLLAAAIVAYARYLHPATFSALVYPFFVLASCICIAVYYIRTRI